MCLHQVHIAFALGTDNGFVVNLQAITDGVELMGDIGPATIGKQGLRRPVAEASRIEHHKRRPARLCWRYSPG
jgi:hypothetical protein